MSLRDDIATRLAAGTAIQRIADLVGVDRRTVIHHAHELGYRVTNDGHAQLIEGRTVNTPTPPPPQQRRHTLGETIAAVNDLRQHKDAKVKKQADRCIGQLRRLFDLLTDYDEKAAARAEVERLEQQLRDAKAKLRGSSAPALTTGDIDSKAVRAWASENGVDCPAVGRVPKHVVDAYQAAAA